MHRHQLDRRDAEPLQVLDHRGVPDARVRAALLLRHVGMQLRQALDVGLVDHRLAVQVARLPVALPVEERLVTTPSIMWAAESSSLRESSSPKV